MSKHEYYEDALFNLLMEEVSDTMGEELLEENKALNESEEADPPDSLLKAGYDTIDRELRSTKRRQRKVIAIKSFRAVSIAALLALVIGVASYISFPQVRNHVQAFLLGGSVSGGSEAPSNNAVSSGDAGRRFEDYEEVDRSYEYTENGIVETITYEDPETGDTFSVKVFTKYRDRSDDESDVQTQQRDSKGRLLITPPTPTPRPTPDPLYSIDPYPRPSTYISQPYSGSSQSSGGSPYTIGPKPVVPGVGTGIGQGGSVRIFPFP